MPVYTFRNEYKNRAAKVGTYKEKKQQCKRGKSVYAVRNGIGLIVNAMTLPQRYRVESQCNDKESPVDRHSNDTYTHGSHIPSKSTPVNRHGSLIRMKQSFSLKKVVKEMTVKKSGIIPLFEEGK